MSHPSIDALIDLLTQEEAIYAEMARLLEEEREALLSLAVVRLGDLASRKETLALRIKAMDESRKLLARRLGLALGLDLDHITISALAQLIPPPGSLHLRAIGDKLRQTVQNCQSINEYNARAATLGRDLVSRSIEFMIQQADPAGPVYQNPKTKGYGGQRGHGASAFISRQA